MPPRSYSRAVECESLALVNLIEVREVEAPSCPVIRDPLCQRMGLSWVFPQSELYVSTLIVSVLSCTLFPNRTCPSGVSCRCSGGQLECGVSRGALVRSCWHSTGWWTQDGVQGYSGWWWGCASSCCSSALQDDVVSEPEHYHHGSACDAGRFSLPRTAWSTASPRPLWNLTAPHTHHAHSHTPLSLPYSDSLLNSSPASCHV